MKQPIEQFKELINKWIKQLKQDGKGTKQEVLKELIEFKERYLDE